MNLKEFLRPTKFKVISNGLVLVILEIYYFNYASGLFVCMSPTECPSFLGAFVRFNIIRIIPIIIATYLLSCFIESFYKKLKSKNNK